MTRPQKGFDVRSLVTKRCCQRVRVGSVHTEPTSERNRRAGAVFLRSLELPKSRPLGMAWPDRSIHKREPYRKRNRSSLSGLRRRKPLHPKPVGNTLSRRPWEPSYSTTSWALSIQGRNTHTSPREESRRREPNFRRNFPTHMGLNNFVLRSSSETVACADGPLPPCHPRAPN